jgi:assimilatory nitrate reductase catalytic subunit
MAARALQDGDCARVESRRGSILLEIRADDGLRGGECFLPMHWSSAFASHAGVNLLMPDAVDPQSRQPELKHAAIQVQAIALPYALDLLFVLDGSDAQAVAIRQLRALLPQLGCAGLRLLGRHQRVMALQARLQQPPEADLLRRLDAIAGLGDAAHEIRYDDVTRGNSRHLRLSHGRLLAARLHASAQDPDAPTIRRVADQQANMVARLSALMDQADDTLPSRSSLRAALSSVSHSGTGTPSRVVCSCFGVREDAIQQAISHGADIPLLKQTLRCGSNCGSCLPELRKLLHSAHGLRQSTA